MRSQERRTRVRIAQAGFGAPATTVVVERGKHTILDRPLMEAKEAIGGFGILDVADLDEAIAIVKTMPQPDGKVEVRPILDRGR